MKKGTYYNILQLAIKNNVYDAWTKEVGPKRTLEDYLTEYSDRNIVEMFLNDMIRDNFIVHPIWDDGCLDWLKTKIEIL